MAFHCSPLLPKRPQDEGFFLFCAEEVRFVEKSLEALLFLLPQIESLRVGLWARSWDEGRLLCQQHSLHIGSEQQHRVPTCIQHIAAGRAVRASCSQPHCPGRKAQVPCLGLGNGRPKSQSVPAGSSQGWKPFSPGGKPWVWEGCRRAWSASCPPSAGPASLS